jgi:transcriptional regulator with XRE-family HTH domain
MARTFAERLSELMTHSYLAEVDVARFVGVSPQLVGRWRSAEDLPRPEDVDALARLTGVSAWELAALLPAGLHLDEPMPEPALLARLTDQHWDELQRLPAPFRAAVLAAQARANLNQVP